MVVALLQEVAAQLLAPAQAAALVAVALVVAAPVQAVAVFLLITINRQIATAGTD